MEPVGAAIELASKDKQREVTAEEEDGCTVRVARRARAACRHAAHGSGGVAPTWAQQLSGGEPKLEAGADHEGAGEAGEDGDGEEVQHDADL